jgi:hypothetical protein
MGPFGFEIPLEARRPRVKVKNLEGPIRMPFTYVKHCPFFFKLKDFMAFFCHHVSTIKFHLMALIIPLEVRSTMHRFCQKWITQHLQKWIPQWRLSFWIWELLNSFWFVHSVLCIISPSSIFLFFQCYVFFFGCV